MHFKLATKEISDTESRENFDFRLPMLSILSCINN